MYQLPSKPQCGGNTYSVLTSKQQSDTFMQLQLSCHSLEVLQRENVILDMSQPAETLPHITGLRIEDFVATPRRTHAIGKRRAVVIACEMSKAEDNGKEPISICIVDFLTGQTLLDSFIAPFQPISDWRSHIHGVTEKSIRLAIKGNNCLQDWQEARAKLFEYVDDQTILVGYMIRNDLEALRVFHKGIVDAQVLTMDAISIKNKISRNKWPVDKVCMEFLGIPIRQNATPRNQMHVPLENALASREIVLRCIQQPEKLVEWGKRKRQEYWNSIDVKKAEGKTIKAVRQVPNKNMSENRPSASNAGANQTANQNGKARPDGTAETRTTIHQSLKNMKINDGTHEADGNSIIKNKLGEGSSKNNGGNSDRALRGAAKGAKKAAKKQAVKEAKKKANNEELGRAVKKAAELKIARAEQTGTLLFDNPKELAKANCKAKHKKDRRAKWEEDQRVD